MRRSWSSHALRHALAAAVIISVATTSAPVAIGEEARSQPAERPDPPLWRDWAITGGGVALFLSGIAWQVQASDDYAEFDSQYAILCPLGCVSSQLPEELSQRLDKARNRKFLAVGSYTLGALVAATGTYYLYRRGGSSDRLLPRSRNLLLIGGGAGAIAIGGILQWLGSRNFAEYDEQFQERCSLSGCFDDTIPDLQSTLSKARLQRNAAFVGYAAGGAVAIAGIVLAFRDRRASTRAVSLAPTIGPQVATLNLQGAF